MNYYHWQYFSYLDKLFAKTMTLGESGVSSNRRAYSFEETSASMTKSKLYKIFISIMKAFFEQMEIYDTKRCNFQ